ncbi:MAG: hypothetical protein IPG89_02395 [Bacteroidetes bacterium]|nr:hypothetical protein [Bacteroidota bacterium]
MNRNKYILETTYKGRPIKLIFIRKNGNNAFRNFHVRSEDDEHKFAIKYNGSVFVIEDIKSNDTTNWFYLEMEKAIELIKDELI